MPERSIRQRLVADVGGTNTRVALFDEQSRELRDNTSYTNRDYDSFEAVITDWLSRRDSAPPERACFAIAAPPSDDIVTMVNMDWSFSRNAIARTFGFKHVRWINDFEANAYALPYLEKDDLRSLQHNGTAKGRLATVGPGTGLGGATLERLASRTYAQACEPGFMSLSPGCDYELALFKLILRDYPDIYAELLVSGPGLLRLYQLACELEGVPVLVDTPAGVSREALSGGDVMCERALETFCGLLGSVCGDFILANGAYGALFLAGGILPRMLPFLERSSFLKRFTLKGAMQAHLQAVPVHVITAPHPGLTGAAYAPI